MRNSAKMQSGATLLVSLIMLLVLTMFAITGFNLSSVNLRIAGNFQNQRMMEAVAQQAIERVLSSATAFTLDAAGQPPAGVPVCVNVAGTIVGTGSCSTNDFTVAVSAAKCNYYKVVTGGSASIKEIPPEATDWELQASVSDPLTFAKAVITQGVRMVLRQGNCPAPV